MFNIPSIKIAAAALTLANTGTSALPPEPRLPDLVLPQPALTAHLETVYFFCINEKVAGGIWRITFSDSNYPATIVTLEQEQGKLIADRDAALNVLPDHDKAAAFNAIGNGLKTAINIVDKDCKNPDVVQLPDEDALRRVMTGLLGPKAAPQ